MINTETLRNMSSVRRYNKGAVITRDNEASNGEMYIIIQGSAGIYKNYQTPNEVRSAVLETGGFFGEASLFLGKARNATLVALTDMLVLAITKQNINELFFSQPQLTYVIMDGLCRRLDQVNTAYEKLYFEAAKNMTQAGAQQQSASSTLFPEGHGSYLLPIDNTKSEYLYEDTFTCPVCGQGFKSLIVLSSRLVADGTDNDLRVHYKDIEPMYYDIVTCPACYYSSLKDQFDDVMPRLRERVLTAIAPYKAGMAIKSAKDRDTFTVFAGYYLAILCAPVCISESQRVTASLWNKLARLYKDCNDQKMYEYATKKALEDYQYAYSNFDIFGKALQQICYILGDLHEKTGNLDEAKNYFFTAINEHDGTPVMRRMAEDRLDELKEKQK